MGSYAASEQVQGPSRILPGLPRAQQKHYFILSATLWQVQRQVISTVKRFTAWSDGLPIAALVYPACYPIFPRAGHEPRNQSQGAGFKLK